MNILEGEIFKPVHGHERYLISNFGRVYSTKRQRFSTPFFETQGFLQVNMDGRNVSLHYAIARAFCTRDEYGNPKRISYVKFKDKDHSHITLDNLTWKESD